MMVHMPAEYLAYCYDCRKILGVNWPYSEDIIHPSISDIKENGSRKNSGYCSDCVKKAIGEGYIFRNGIKTSLAIERMCEESEMIWKQSLKNQYY